MESFTCVVCYEVSTARLPLGKLMTTNGDTLRADDCKHPICEVCLASFVIARVEERIVFDIRCPYEGCKRQVYEQDVQTLVGKGLVPSFVGERLANLRQQVYAGRTSELTDAASTDDADLLRTLWATTRCCPRCGVIIQKSSGCDSFGCICGHKFNFAEAPRGCGDGIHNFNNVTYLAAERDMPLKNAMALVQEGSKRGIHDLDTVTHLAAQHRLSPHDAMTIVEGGLKKGISNYESVLVHAERLHVPLSLAEVYVQAHLGQDVDMGQLRDARLKPKLSRKLEKQIWKARHLRCLSL